MQWISVEEQQPEGSGKYLVCCAFLIRGEAGAAAHQHGILLRRGKKAALGA